MARWVGPPPRPTVPPRPWKSRSFTPHSRATSCSARWALVDLPGAGEHAAVFVGVGVAEHHLLPVVPGVEQLAIASARSTVRGRPPGAFRRSSMDSNSGTGMQPGSVRRRLRPERPPMRARPKHARGCPRREAAPLMTYWRIASRCGPCLSARRCAASPAHLRSPDAAPRLAVPFAAAQPAAAETSRTARRGRGRAAGRPASAGAVRRCAPAAAADRPARLRCAHRGSPQGSSARAADRHEAAAAFW